MKRRFVAAMLAGVMACSLAGCNTKSPMAGKEETTTAAGTQAGSDTQAALAEGETDKQAEAAGPITIQFWNAFTGTDGDVLREIVDRYNKENTRGITIEMDIMPASSLEEKLPAAIASKTAPALIIRGNFDTATYTDRKSTRLNSSHLV